MTLSEKIWDNNSRLIVTEISTEEELGALIDVPLMTKEDFLKAIEELYSELF